MRSLEGANCADLPGFVIDKYFDANVHTERFRARTALAICSHCIVQAACREEALNMPNLQGRGVIGGVTANEVLRARHWRNYEQGRRDTAPPGPRPPWLARAEAAETTERALIETDPDEA